METTAEEIYTLLVPLHQARLIVPRACVAEIIRYSPPQGRGADMPDWFLGYTPWNDRRVPTVQLETLCGLPASDPGGRTRIAIFNGLSGNDESVVFGVQTEGFPQLLRVNHSVMEPHDEQEWPDDGPIICQIRMINEYPLIPDLERIESLVREQIAA